MNKLTGRVEKLVRKTHSFVTYEEHCLMRDYFKARLATEEIPDGSYEIINKIYALYSDATRTTAEIETEVEKLLIGPSVAVRLHLLLAIEERYCNRYPMGSWMDSTQMEIIPKILRWARDFFGNIEGDDGEEDG